LVFEDSVICNCNSDLKFNHLVHFAAQNEREAEDEFGFHGLFQSGPFFAFVRAMSNFNGN
jgi:hypothetical protein